MFWPGGQPSGTFTTSFPGNVQPSLGMGGTNPSFSTPWGGGQPLLTQASSMVPNPPGTFSVQTLPGPGFGTGPVPTPTGSGPQFPGFGQPIPRSSLFASPFGTTSLSTLSTPSPFGQAQPQQIQQPFLAPSLWGSQPSVSTFPPPTPFSFPVQTPLTMFPSQTSTMIVPPLPILSPVMDLLQAAASAYDPSSSSYRFRYFFYNRLPVQEVGRIDQYLIKPLRVEDALWNQALANNPNPVNRIPVLAVGPDDLQRRMQQHAVDRQKQQTQMKDIEDRIRALHTWREFSMWNKRREQRERHQKITQRIVHVMCLLERMRQSTQSIHLTPFEETLHFQLQSIQEVLSHTYPLKRTGESWGKSSPTSFAPGTYPLPLRYRLEEVALRLKRIHHQRGRMPSRQPTPPSSHSLLPSSIYPSENMGDFPSLYSLQQSLLDQQHSLRQMQEWMNRATQQVETLNRLYKEQPRPPRPVAE